MPAPTRSDFQREADLVKTAAMYLMGKTQAEIARTVKVSRTQIAYDLKAIRDQWRERAARDFDAHVAEELARLDQLEATYWKAWEESRRQRTTRLEEEGSGPNGPTSKTRVTKQKGAGNARFLEGVFACIDRRIRLLGLDAPAKVDVNLRDYVERESAALGLDADDVWSEIQELAQSAWDRGNTPPGQLS